MIHPPSAFDAIQTGSRQTLFNLFGVPWTITHESWQFITSRFFMGILIAIIFLRELSLTERLVTGLLIGVLVGVSNVLHILGHWIGGKLVSAPMDENLITQYSILTAYHENPDEVPGRIHLARSIGGPLLTLIVGIVSFFAWRIWGGNTLGFLATLNLVLGVGLSLPIPHADGEVIWREVHRLRKKTQEKEPLR